MAAADALTLAPLYHLRDKLALAVDEARATRAALDALRRALGYLNAEIAKQEDPAEWRFVRVSLDGREREVPAADLARLRAESALRAHTLVMRELAVVRGIADLQDMRYRFAITRANLAVRRPPLPLTRRRPGAIRISPRRARVVRRRVASRGSPSRQDDPEPHDVVERRAAA